jgi:phage tail sheath protein FI
LPVTTSYPGIYIEELPSASHSVSAAPTSVTVFVGYTNPFWMGPPNATTPPPFGAAVELFSFADYQAYFGGFFTSPWLPDYVGQAVFQFFMNGGSDAFVVALPAVNEFYFDATGKVTTTKIAAATAALVKGGNGFTFTALQPVGIAGTPDLGLTMTLTVSNIITTGGVTDDTADLTIVYGTTVETYRRLLIGDLVATVSARSRLASVVATGAPTTYDVLPPMPVSFIYAKPPTAGWTTIDPLVFGAVFADNAPLDKVSIFNLMALPGLTDPTALAEALSYCERKRAFFIMDPPATAVADALAETLPSAPANPAPMADIWNGAAVNTPPTPAPPVSPNGAIYFPYLQTTDPVTGAAAISPPSGFVAGIFAREDNNRGVWKSPAGLETTILGTTGVVPSGNMTDPQQGVLNQLGVNCLRTFPGIGSVVFGARTLVSMNSAFEQWKYVAVRRMALFIEQSLYGSLGWAIFEPNDIPLWNALTQEVQAFMLGLFRQGAFQGATADQAFQVVCDSTTTSQADIDNGIVNILVGFAPLKPAEFVVVQIAQLAGQTQS